MDVVEPCFYQLPDSEPVTLKVAPRLASWEASGHRDQVRLGQYLDYVVELLKQRSDAVAGPRAVRLDIGVARKFDLLGNAIWITTFSRWPPGQVAARIWRWFRGGRRNPTNFPPCFAVHRL